MSIAPLSADKILLIKNWIREVLKKYTPQAKPLKDIHLPRLSAFASEALRSNISVVEVDTLPLPPVEEWGIHQLDHFVHEPFIAITYLNTLFILKKESLNEVTLFHELVHALQWRILGEDRFLFLYTKGLLEDMYYTSPLEMMAYELQEEFENNEAPFDLEKKVEEELKKLLQTTQEP